MYKICQVCQRARIVQAIWCKGLTLTGHVPITETESVPIKSAAPRSGPSGWGVERQAGSRSAKHEQEQGE